MAASDHLSNVQFMSVEDLSYPNVKIDDKKAKTLSDAKNEEGRYHDVMDKTYEEAHEEGLHRSIESHGVQTPVTLSKQDGQLTLVDGHHRIATAQRHLPPDTMIPVKFESNK
jgi:hypothetical protein